MKKIIPYTIMVMIGVFCEARYSLAGISGTAHDFSDQIWATEKICQVCHIPHNADTSIAATLWGHELPALPYNLLYSSSSLQEIPGQPGGASLVCLSCHDGSVALDAFGGNPGSVYMDSEGAAFIDRDLKDDHPIGIPWGHKQPPNCTNCHDRNATFIGSLPFYDGKVECSTCHDPHINGSGNKFLRLSQKTELCLYCHGK